MSDESTTLRAEIDRAFVPVVSNLARAIGRLESVAKHGSGDQSPHGNRNKGNPGGTTPADRGAQAARADDNARSKDKPIDRDALYNEFVASTDQEFELMAELKQATGPKAAAIQRKLDKATKKSRRLWSIYRMSEDTVGADGQVHRMTMREILAASPDHPIFRPDTPKVQVVSPKTRRTVREDATGRKK